MAVAYYFPSQLFTVLSGGSALGLTTVSAGQFWAGPVSGSATAPSYRAFSYTDFATSGSSGQVLTLAGTDSHLTWATPSTGSAAGVLTVTNNASNIITTTGSPVTLPGTITLTVVQSPTFTGNVTGGTITSTGPASFAGTLNVGTAGTLTSAGVLVTSGSATHGGNLTITGGGTLTTGGSLSLGGNLFVGSSGTMTNTGTIITSGAATHSSLTATGLTSGSVPFVTTGGRITDNNTAMFWDNTNLRLGLGTTTPQDRLDVFQGKIRFVDANSTSIYYQIYSARISSDDRLIINSSGTGFGSRVWIDTPNSGPAFSLAQAGTEYLAFGNTAAGDYGFTVYQNNNFVIKTGNTSGTEKLRLTTAGLLGIGLTPTAVLTLKAGTATASTAPLKFTGGALLSSPEVGAVEYQTDNWYATISTGTSRVAFVLDNGTRLTSGLLPVATTNGRLADSSFKPAGSLFNHFTDAGNGTTVETDLYSDTIAAGQLATNGDKLGAAYGGVFVSSGTATREIRLYFAGTALFDTGALTLSLSSAWTMYVEIIRVSASVVRYMISLTTQGAALAAYTAAGELTGLTLANTAIIKVTGQAAGVGAASNDIVAKMGYVRFDPA